MENKLRHTILDGPTSDDFFKSYYSNKPSAFFYVSFKTEIGEFTCKITGYLPKDAFGKEFKFKGVDDCDRIFTGDYNTETKEGNIEW